MNNTLGFALPCAKYGSDVGILLDRCEAVMFNPNTTASFPKILGHAMAHEIGHILPGTNCHSSTGLMKARWDKTDWQRVAAAHLAIGRAELKTMWQNTAEGAPGNLKQQRSGRNAAKATCR